MDSVIGSLFGDSNQNSAAANNQSVFQTVSKKTTPSCIFTVKSDDIFQQCMNRTNWIKLRCVTFHSRLSTTNFNNASFYGFLGNLDIYSVQNVFWITLMLSGLNSFPRWRKMVQLRMQRLSRSSLTTGMVWTGQQTMTLIESLSIMNIQTSIWTRNIKRIVNPYSEHRKQTHKNGNDK